ncbi:hypothetical protein RFI_24384, partial [Reticulomyxa filosa]
DDDDDDNNNNNEEEEDIEEIEKQQTVGKENESDERNNTNVERNDSRNLTNTFVGPSTVSWLPSTQNTLASQRQRELLHGTSTFDTPKSTFNPVQVPNKLSPKIQTPQIDGQILFANLARESIHAKTFGGMSESQLEDAMDDSVVQSPMILPAPYPGIMNYVPQTMNNTNVVPLVPHIAEDEPYQRPGVDMIGHAHNDKDQSPSPWTESESTQFPQPPAARKVPVAIHELVQIVGSDSSMPDLPSSRYRGITTDSSSFQFVVDKDRQTQKWPLAMQYPIPVTKINIPDNKASAPHRPPNAAYHHPSGPSATNNARSQTTVTNARNWNGDPLDRDHDPTESGTQTFSLLQGNMALSGKNRIKEPPSLAKESFYPQGDSSVMIRDPTSGDLTETHRTNTHADMFSQQFENDNTGTKQHVVSL